MLLIPSRNTFAFFLLFSFLSIHTLQAQTAACCENPKYRSVKLWNKSAKIKLPKSMMAGEVADSERVSRSGKPIQFERYITPDSTCELILANQDFSRVTEDEAMQMLMIASSILQSRAEEDSTISNYKSAQTTWQGNAMLVTDRTELQPGGSPIQKSYHLIYHKSLKILLRVNFKYRGATASCPDLENAVLESLKL